VPSGGLDPRTLGVPVHPASSGAAPSGFLSPRRNLG